MLSNIEEKKEECIDSEEAENNSRQKEMITSTIDKWFVYYLMSAILYTVLLSCS